MDSDTRSKEASESAEAGTIPVLCLQGGDIMLNLDENAGEHDDERVIAWVIELEQRIKDLEARVYSLTRTSGFDSYGEHLDPLGPARRLNKSRE